MGPRAGLGSLGGKSLSFMQRIDSPNSRPAVYDYTELATLAVLLSLHHSVRCSVDCV
jgi:hypothetical protein